MVAVCDINEERVNKVQMDFDIPKGYTNYDGMLNDPDIDAFLIATGAALHKEHAVKALEANKHVFCEKPLAKTLEDCKAIEATVEKHSDKMFTVGFIRRYDPTYMEAKRKIDAGEIGRVIHVKCNGLDPATVLDTHLEDAIGVLLADAIKTVKSGGSILLFGMNVSAKQEISQNDIVAKGIAVYGNFIGNRTLLSVANAIESGLVDFSAMITHKLPLERFGEGLKAMKKGEAMEVVLYP